MYVTVLGNILMQYNNEAVKNYDKFYSSKDYGLEVDFIEKITHGFTGKSIIDIGCGTGTHSILMSTRGASFVKGIDISDQMIKAATYKSNELSNINFENIDIESMTAGQYDIAVSLFNVVNHISDIGKLISFMSSINRNMVTGGHFIFDSWNGVAAIKDSPKVEKKEYEDSGVKIYVECNPTVDLMESSVVLNTTVKKLDQEYSYSLEHYLWTPKVVSDVLKLSGFKLLKICKGFNLDLSACEDDYKITYICIAE